VLASTRFNGLIAALQLSAAERAAGSAAVTAVSGTLTGRFDEAHVIAIGAWAKGTEIRPPRDIDLLLILPGRPGVSAAGNASLEVLHDVKEALMPLRRDAHLRRDGRAVVVPFDEAVVEVSAGYGRGDGVYDLCDAGAGGRFRAIAPDAERAALDQSDRRTRGCTRALVRLLKAWQSHRGVPLSSFAIELVAVEFLATWEHAADGSRYYDWLVRDAFAFLAGHADTPLEVPGTGESFLPGEAWISLARVAYAHAAKACEYETGNRDRDAWWEWEKIFGDAVPFDEPPERAA
jgi:hypothetical protein